MNTFTEQFSALLEGYLKRTATDATSFGRNAVGTPNFVFRIRSGKSTTLRTADKVRQYILDNPVRPWV